MANNHNDCTDEYDRNDGNNGNGGKLPILEVRGLKTYFYTEDGVVQAVNGVDFTICEGEVMGLVGESGSGKSVTSLSIMRLLAASGKIVEGEVRFKNCDLARLTEDEMVRIRGEQMSMIFQQPTSCLNPVFTAGDQIGEVLSTLRSVGIAHGDPTTRNMIVSDKRIYLIDFGLASYDRSLEARGVDVHVFFQSLEASHEDYRALKKAFLAGYTKKCRDAEQVLSKVEEIKGRGRYL